MYFHVGFPLGDDTDHEEPNQDKDKDATENPDNTEDIGEDNNDEDKGIDKDSNEGKGIYVHNTTCIYFLSLKNLIQKLSPNGKNGSGV